ncbi:MAG: hypothetical protein AABZ32_02410 [Bacteroidota bacterium]
MIETNEIHTLLKNCSADSREIINELLESEIKTINPEKKPLTVETLRTFPGFEKVSDEEANEIIFSLHVFLELFHEFYVELEKMKSNGEIKDIIAFLSGEEKIKEQNLKQAA